MSSKNRTKYHVRKRIFLTRDLEMRAFAVAVVEDTRDVPNDSENGWQYGTIQLNLADCNRHVSFDFDMDTKRSRRDSLYKIRRIAQIVNAVRDALEIEAKSIESRKIVKPKAKAKAAAG